MVDILEDTFVARTSNLSHDHEANI